MQDYEELIMNELQGCVNQAIKMLIKFDGELIKTQPKEECINHKLAQRLEEILKKNRIIRTESVDIEYDKYKKDEKKNSQGKKIRPDIIVHQRRSGNENNLIVIEAKKNYPSKHDRDKVEDLMESQNYQYFLGVLISYQPNRPYIRVEFRKDSKWEPYWIDKQTLEISSRNR